MFIYLINFEHDIDWIIFTYETHINNGIKYINIYIDFVIINKLNKNDNINVIVFNNIDFCSFKPFVKNG